MPETAVTLRDALAAAARCLRPAGIADPRREALRLWSGLRGVPPGAAYLDGARALDEAEAAAWETAVRRRAAGEPLAYVTGRAGFRRLTLRADARALIPRPETEGLVDHLLARVDRGRVADIGTGGGCLALSLAAEGRFEAVVAVDRSAAALALAADNAREAGLPVRFARGDLTAPLGSGCFDAVVSNPPYLTDAEYAALDGSVRDWEPRLAFPSGPDGLDATRRILRDGLRVLRPGGWLALEVDATRGTAAARRAVEEGWSETTLLEDLFGRTRYLLARRRD